MTGDSSFDQFILWLMIKQLSDNSQCILQVHSIKFLVKSKGRIWAIYLYTLWYKLYAVKRLLYLCQQEKNEDFWREY